MEPKVPTPKANLKGKPANKLLKLKGRTRILKNSLMNENGYLADAIADVKFVCESGKIVRAHRVLLCLASQYFTNILQDQDSAEVSVVLIPDIPAEVMIVILTMLYNGDKFLIPEGLEDKVIEWLQEFDLSSKIVLDDASGSEMMNEPVHPPAAVESVVQKKVDESDSEHDFDSARPLKKRKINVAEPGNMFERRKSGTMSFSGDSTVPMEHNSQGSPYGEPPLLDTQCSQRYYGEAPKLDKMIDAETAARAAMSILQPGGAGTSSRSVTAADVNSAVFKMPMMFNANAARCNRTSSPKLIVREVTPVPEILAPKRGRGRPRNQSAAPIAKPSAFKNVAQPEFQKPQALSSSRSSSHTRSTSRKRSPSRTRTRSSSRSRSRVRSRSYARFDVNDKDEDYRGLNLTKLIGENPRSARLQKKLKDFSNEGSGSNSGAQ